jgi:hypothetical protein
LYLVDSKAEKTTANAAGAGVAEERGERQEQKIKCRDLSTTAAKYAACGRDDNV